MSASNPELLCFVTGSAPHPLKPGRMLYTACALTSQGKWVGGSVSGESPDVCWKYLKNMEPRFRERWSAPFVMRWTEITDPRVLGPLAKCLESMP